MAIPGVPDNRKYDHRPSTALYMARQGKSFIMKGTGLTTLSGGVVQTGAGTFKAIPDGSAAVVKGFMLHLHTLSKNVIMEIGYTSVADGTGDFVAASPRIMIHTGDKHTGIGSEFITLPVPMYLT